MGCMSDHVCSSAGGGCDSLPEFSYDKDSDGYGKLQTISDSACVYGTGINPSLNPPNRIHLLGGSNTADDCDSVASAMTDGNIDSNATRLGPYVNN